MIFTQPVCYEFSLLKMPVLLIVGSLDRTAVGKDRAPADAKEKLGNYPKLGKETAAKIPDCKLVELPGVGHLPQMEDYPDYIAAVKNFLK
jgi:pimeloyl-ACP methyl ester carboxylesterase